MENVTFDEAERLASRMVIKGQDVPAGVVKALLLRLMEVEDAPAVPVMNADGVALRQRIAFRKGFLAAREFYGGSVPEDDYDPDEDGDKEFHGAECLRADNSGYICTCDDEGAESNATDFAVSEYPGNL